MFSLLFPSIAISEPAPLYLRLHISCITENVNVCFLTPISIITAVSKKLFFLPSFFCWSNFSHCMGLLILIINSFPSCLIRIFYRAIIPQSEGWNIKLELHFWAVNQRMSHLKLFPDWNFTSGCFSYAAPLLNASGFWQWLWSCSDGLLYSFTQSQIAWIQVQSEEMKCSCIISRNIWGPNACELQFLTFSPPYASLAVLTLPKRILKIWAILCLLIWREGDLDRKLLVFFKQYNCLGEIVGSGL